VRYNPTLTNFQKHRWHLKKQKRLSQNSNLQAKTTFHRPPAGGHGTVVFAVVTTVPCSGSNFSEELKSLPERWDVVTICCFETAPFLSVEPEGLASPSPVVGAYHQKHTSGARCVYF